MGSRWPHSSPGGDGPGHELPLVLLTPAGWSMSQALRSIALLVVLVGGVLVGVSFDPDGPDTGPKVAARIHPGMTVDEAAAVIGVPPGDYRLKADQTPYFIGFKFPQGSVRYRWAGYRGYIYVVGGRYRDRK